MNNPNKFKLSHYRNKLENSGAIGTLNSPTLITNQKVTGTIEGILIHENLSLLNLRLNEEEQVTIPIISEGDNFDIGEQIHFSRRYREFPDGSYDITEKMIEVSYPENNFITQKHYK